MIHYSLKCGAGHRFDSWFQNTAAFAALEAARQLTCPVCGANEVEKDLMAPSVRPARKAADAAKETSVERAADAASPVAAAGAPNLRDPGTDLEAAIAALRKQIAENSEYVGMNFAAEARRIHDGDAPERAIYGEARPEEARQMIEDGLPVAPLPFVPTRKVN
jgi:hypothetical protein